MSHRTLTHERVKERMNRAKDMLVSDRVTSNQIAALHFHGEIDPLCVLDPSRIPCCNRENTMKAGIPGLDA
jgi:hypothetical protein